MTSPRRCRARPGQTLTLARPFRRRAARIARPALVRMRSRNPCVLARRRLFGWNVRLLTGNSRLRWRQGPVADRGAHQTHGRLPGVAESVHGTRVGHHWSNQRPPAKAPDKRAPEAYPALPPTAPAPPRPRPRPGLTRGAAPTRSHPHGPGPTTPAARPRPHHRAVPPAPHSAQQQLYLRRGPSHPHGDVPRAPTHRPARRAGNGRFPNAHTGCALGCGQLTQHAAASRPRVAAIRPD
jgi:hypothetical protein